VQKEQNCDADDADGKQRMLVSLEPEVRPAPPFTVLWSRRTCCHADISQSCPLSIAGSGNVKLLSEQGSICGLFHLTWGGHTDEDLTVLYTCSQ
jgi:hypothetical protein